MCVKLSDLFPSFSLFFFPLRFFTAAIHIGCDRLHRTVPPFCIVQQKDASVTTWKIIPKKVYVIRLQFTRRQLEWNEEKLNEQFLSCDFFTRYLRDRVISKQNRGISIISGH